MKKINWRFHLRAVVLATLASILIVLFGLTKLFFLLFALGLILVMVIDGFFLLSTIGGAIYLPTAESYVERMVKLSTLKPGEKMIDIGSGDGRIVLAFAKAGARAIGCEINLLLVLRSFITLHRHSFVHRPKIFWGSFWQHNFHQYDVVTLFGIPYIMRGLEKKLQRELRPGARVISYVFPFPKWKPTRVEGKVFVYEKR